MGGRPDAVRLRFLQVGVCLSNQIEPQSSDGCVPKDVGYSWIDSYFRPTVLSPAADCVWGAASPALFSIRLDQSLTPAPSVFV